MYTSFSPNDERFGFRMTGQFNCSYKMEKLFFILLMVGAAGYVVLLILNLVLSVTGSFNEDGEIIGGLVDTSGAYTTMSGGFMSFAVNSIINAFSIFLLILLIPAFLVGITILRRGQVYRFKADEEAFEIEDPKGNVTTIYYSDVVAVIGDDRVFPPFSKGIDISVRTKDKSYEYAFIHNTMSKANGISETPFNIIMERANLAKKPVFLEMQAYKDEDTWK